MSCGTPASSLSNVSVVALFAGNVIVVVSNASPEAVTVVVVPPLGPGAPDAGGAGVGGPPLAGGRARSRAGRRRVPLAARRSARRRPTTPTTRWRHGDRSRHVCVDVVAEEV